MNVHGQSTKLCPEDLTEGGFKKESFPVRIGLLFSDLFIVYSHIIYPDELKKGLPPVSHSWRGFLPREGTPFNEGVRPGYRNYRQQIVVDFIDSIEKSEVPTLHFLHASLPHHHYDLLPSGQFYAPRGVLDGLVNKSQWMDDQVLVDLAKQRYLLQVGFVDMLLGRLLDHLKAEGLYDRSLLIVTADHGVSFRAGQPMRHFTDQNYPELLSVPLFIKLPGQRRGEVSDRLVSTIDIMPTIANVLGTDIPWDVHGTSVLAREFPRREKVTIYTPNQKLEDFEFNLASVVAFPTLESQLSLYGSRSPLMGYLVDSSSHNMLWLGA